MQRSFNRARVYARLAALGLLIAGVLAGAPARAAQDVPRQPVTFTVKALTHAPGDPTGTTYVAVNAVKPGDTFFYNYVIQPRYNPNEPLALSTTPITISARFDPRLEALTVGTDGSCVGVIANRIDCVDPFGGNVQEAKLSALWVWFRVKASSNPAPITMYASSHDTTAAITLQYTPRNVLYMPVFRH